MSISTRKEFPQPKTTPLLGNIPDIAVDPVQALMRLARSYGPLFKIGIPGAQTMLVVGSQALAHEVCDEARFEKKVHSALEQLRSFVGDGLFTAYNQEPNWGRAHRILMPAFSPNAMRGYFDSMLDIAEQMFVKWQRVGPEVEIPVADNMTRLTLDTIALCGFGYRFNSFYQHEMHPFVDAMVRTLVEAGGRSRRPNLQTKLMVRTGRQYAADLQLMHGMTQDLISKRRASGSTDRNDLLDRMLNAADPQSGESLDDENIRNQLLTFLVAGHETTSGLLSFAIHLLMESPQALERARAEVDSVLQGGAPTFEKMSQLQFIEQILCETLRLYPTAPAMGMQARADTTIGGGYPVTPADALMVLLPTLHRDPQVWQHPEQFYPDHFTPAARNALPPHAWMPFGAGTRACIGRAFAMQEATLVLAMMVQRFDFVRPGPYALHITETLTLKPTDLRIRVRPRASVPRAMPRAVAAFPAAPEAAVTAGVEVAAAHGEPVCVLYGSNTGSSEAFARRLANDAAARGYAVTLTTLDAQAGSLPRVGAVIIVTASYDGQPPDNARAFCTWLGSVPAHALQGVRYALLGCGNTDWGATYQAVPQQIDDCLRAAGATALVPRGFANARADFFGEFEQWHGALWSPLATALGVENAQADGAPLYQVQVLPKGDMDLVQQNHLAYARLLDNRELVDMRAPGARSKRHLELQLPEGLTYRCGDYLAILPQNHPEVVDRLVRRLQLRGDSVVALHAARAAAAALPLDRPMALRELLTRYVELSTPATRRDVQALADKNVCPPHRAHLTALAGDAARYQTEILDKRVSVLDLLEQYASCDVSLAQVLEMLPIMRLRTYSVASSPRVSPSLCAMTVSVVDSAAASGHGRYRGTASSYLARLVPGDAVAVALRTPHADFRPPDEAHVPLVMVAAGTGIAPFRGFLQDRAARQALGEVLAPALLFFGCDHPEVDYLYRDELAAWQSAGLVSVLPAFFRQPEGAIAYVQHRMLQHAEKLAALLAQGARIYVCGDGTRMAPAVRHTMALVHQHSSGCSAAEGAAFVTELERQGRYVVDVF